MCATPEKCQVKKDLDTHFSQPYGAVMARKQADYTTGRATVSWQKWFDSGRTDASALAAIFKANAGLVRACGGRDEEHVAIGNLALVQAIHDYDPARASFSTYAHRCIVNAIRQHGRSEVKHLHEALDFQAPAPEDDRRIPICDCRVLRRLSRQDRKLLMLYYSDNHTQQSLGKAIGKSRQEANYLLAMAMRRAREVIRDEA